MIAEEIGRTAIAAGWESTIFYGQSRGATSVSNIERVGTDLDVRLHGLETRLLDNHGLASRAATMRLVKRLTTLNPDVVHLHNIHGYYLNYPTLFKWLRDWGGPVVWTLHDIWPISGHCAYFGVDECPKWRSGCKHCPHLRSYPASFFLDRSKRNWQLKREIFTSLPNLTLVPVSNWLSELIGESYLSNVPRRVIHNGVDTNVFRPSACGKSYILGVANVWEERKGLKDFFMLRELLPTEIDIKLVGLTEQQIATLPPGIEGITRTTSQHELAELYASALAFVNPTYEDNFPTVNIEALACGTPVVTYRTGGSPEAIDERTGIIIERGDITAIAIAIKHIAELDRREMKQQCRKRALTLFDKNDRYGEYELLYRELINVKNGGGYLIAVANNWTKEKGFDDILKLSKLLASQKTIIMVGLTQNQIDNLPKNIIGLRRTNGRNELSMLYAGADALINPTYGDNFPTVNIEALACGTPVVTYRTGGSPEAIDAKTGVVVERGDVRGLAEAIKKVEQLGPAACRARAVEFFSASSCYQDYVQLYEEILNQ